MEIQHWLRRSCLGPQVALNISEGRFEELKSARLTLVDAGAFEHKYELVLGNYIALETFCAEWSLRGDLEMDYRYERWAEVIATANRHVMNLLSTGRSYADQIVRDFGHLDVSPSFHEQAKALLSKAYDGSKSYRFVCELRNFVQHRAAPVHGITTEASAPARSDSMVLYCSKEKIVEDRGEFRTRVLEESEDKVDLRRTLNEYLHQISLVHTSLRKLISSTCTNARHAHELAISEYCAAQQQDSQDSATAVGLSISRAHGEETIESIPIMLDWDNARLLLASKNRYPTRIVTLGEKP